MPPKKTNVQRQDTNESTHATRSGVNAPPQRALSHMIPWARTRSAAGNQMVKALVRLGKQPASPAPKQKRQRISERALQAQPVAAVNVDHMTTTRMRTLRGPMRSPKRPPGISIKA